jgi:transaldolase
MTTAARVHGNKAVSTTLRGRRRVAVFADGASIADMVAAMRLGVVAGFTTNPTLMAKAGVSDYEAFGREALKIVREMPISFEVLADDLPQMERQARKLASWGDNVYVKVPISTTSGESTLDLVRGLSRDGLKINITAVLTLDQVRRVVNSVSSDTPAICSIFAGRIADTGIDPMPVMREAVRLCAVKPELRVLWASPREVLNIYQADECGCHYIAVTPDLIAKLPLQGKDLDEFSRETVEMFFRDAKKAGLTL